MQTVDLSQISFDQTFRVPIKFYLSNWGGFAAALQPI